ncbi:hypothetical protein RN001_001859 [Aquatica leii]|uniref:Uncharacterized protein n=1 Tax=Aquatica leii TaxID=1421715 RepID=A0AAN7QN43_9COLE|nr:hypothetical protein RN001_001859 [Aquatica leii]
MSRSKSSLSAKISSWIDPYNKTREVFSTDGKAIYCNICEKSIKSEKKFVVDAHANTGYYIANLLVGMMGKEYKKPYLIASKHLQATNFETVCQFINASLKIFPDGVEQRLQFTKRS